MIVLPFSGGKPVLLLGRGWPALFIVFGSWVQAQAGRGPWLSSSLLEPWLETWLGPNPPLPKVSCKLGGEEGRPFKTKTPMIGKIKPKDLAGQVSPAKNKSLDFKANRLPPLTNKRILLKTKCKNTFRKRPE